MPTGSNTQRKNASVRSKTPLLLQKRNTSAAGEAEAVGRRKCLCRSCLWFAVVGIGEVSNAVGTVDALADQFASGGSYASGAMQTHPRFVSQSVRFHCAPTIRMHVVQLAELAAVIAHHGPALLYRHSTVPPEAINSYWTASRVRLDLWHQTLARFNRAKNSGNHYRMRCWWQDHMGVLEEILASELLTRVIAAIAEGSDRAGHRDEFSPIAQAIYLSHLEARNRVQAAILDRRGCTVSDAVRLNRLRCMIERWIDVLIGQLAGHDLELARYGIDIERTTAHAKDYELSVASPTRETIAWLTRASMTDAIRQKVAKNPSLPQANRDVADSALLILRPDLFDSVGNLKSLWMHRIENDSDRTDHMIGEYLRPDVEESPTASAFDMIHAAALSQWFR